MIRFGTDGIRGPAGTWPIVPEVARALGRVAARRAARVILGGDTRPSTAELLASLAAGVAGAGGTARDLGVVPTSVVGLAVASDPGAVGVVVTASHNPAGENGFKWIGERGRKPDDAQAASLSADVGAELERPTLGAGRIEGGRAAALAGWRAALEAAVDTGALHGRTLAIDLANGAAAACWPWLLALPIHWRRVDGAGAINDGFGSEHPAALQRAAAGCDGGLAVDGDGDRCVLVDGTGARIPGDALLWRLALHRGAKDLVVTVQSSAGIELGLPGVNVVRTDVGDRFVRAAMDAHDIALGGEESGHLLFGDFPAGDGLLAGLRALAAAFNAAPTLTEAFAGFPVLPRAVRKVPAGSRRPLDQRHRLTEAVRGAEAALGPGGRTLLRYSGTEPVLRILVEGTDPERVARAADAIADAAVEDP